MCVYIENAFSFLFLLNHKSEHSQGGHLCFGYIKPEAKVKPVGPTWKARLFSSTDILCVCHVYQVDGCCACMPDSRVNTRTHCGDFRRAENMTVNYWRVLFFGLGVN